MKQHRALSITVALALLSQLACQVLDFVVSPAPTPVRVPAIAVTGGETSVPTVAPVVPASPVLAGASPTIAEPSVAPPTVANPCTNPEAIITFPSMDSTVSGMIEIRGTATKANMNYWKVEYRPNASTAFDVLSRSDKPLIDGVLARLSTKTVPNGVYWLQLAVVGKDGNYGTPCQIRITIAN